MKRKEKDAERKTHALQLQEEERERQNAQWNIRLKWNPDVIVWREEPAKTKQVWVKKQKPQPTQLNVNSVAFVPEAP